MASQVSFVYCYVGRVLLMLTCLSWNDPIYLHRHPDIRESTWWHWICIWLACLRVVFQDRASRNSPVPGWYCNCFSMLQQFPAREWPLEPKDSTAINGLTLWTQSLHSISPIHRSSACGVKINKKCFACRMLLIKLQSNLPASRRSTSMKVLKPRIWSRTLSKLIQKENVISIFCIVKSLKLLPSQLRTIAASVANKHVQRLSITVYIT